MIERADCGAMLAAADALAALGANLAIAMRSSARRKRAGPSEHSRLTNSWADAQRFALRRFLVFLGEVLREATVL